ncbi:MAG: histidinol dehydrogenase [Deltaproteobacteria bacterium]|nr:histidinol dehydrogenase [Deltaproteobacteria bacterium]
MDVEQTVKKILKEVRQNGDRAVLKYTKQFDHHSLRAKKMEVTRSERKAAWKKVSPELIRALRMAASRIHRFHERQQIKSWELREKGVRTGLRWSPIERVGIYVPGGRASYPSSVLMNAIPAKVAGVSTIIMTTPFPSGKGNPALLVAADLAGVDRIFKIGGAQAIGALAYGTKGIPSVDKIVGPGNVYVAEAKRQLFGTVGIDMVAGPTEIVIIADLSANPAWIAADLIAQAEHDPEARPLVLSPSRSLLKKVRQEVEKRISRMDRKEIIHASFMKHGDAIHVTSLEKACELSNRIAPEHLEIHVKKPRKLLPKIRHAGAIFLGPYSPAALGDYAAGPNHVLPTSATARFSSPLGVYDFIHASSVVQVSKAGWRRLSLITRELALSEGLTAHAESVCVRKNVGKT